MSPTDPHRSPKPPTTKTPTTTAFCDGPMGQYCDHLRVLRINESESLGPAMARYFASKLWHGEAFYMQIDAHMFFAEVRSVRVCACACACVHVYNTACICKAFDSTP